MRAMMLAAIAALVLTVAAHAQDARRDFEHAYYLEHAKRDYAGAAKAYRKALAGFAKDPAMSLRCRVRLAGCLLEMSKLAEAQKVLAPLRGGEPAVAPEKTPAPRLAWRTALPAPVASLLVGERYAAARDGAGRLHVLDGTGKVVFSSAHGKTSLSDGMRPLDWQGDRLLVAGSALIGVLDVRKQSWVRIWESRAAGGVAGGWLDGEGVTVVGRDGGVFGRGGRSPRTMRGRLDHVRRVGSGLLITRGGTVECWELGGRARWSASLGREPVRDMAVVGETLMCLQASRLCAVELATGKVTRGWTVSGRAVSRTSDGRGALVFADGKALRIDPPSEAARAIALPIAAPVGAGWIGRRLLIAERAAVSAIAPGRDAVAGAPSADWAAALRKKLASRTITLDFSAAPLKDVLAFIAQVNKTCVVLADADKAQSKVTMSVRELRADKALSLIAELQGLRWAPRHGVIVVGRESTLRRFGPGPWPGKGLPDTAPWRALATRTLTVDFSKTPASDVFTFIREISRCNIVLADPAVRERALTFRVSNQPILRVIALAAAMANATVELRAGVLLVRTRPPEKSLLGFGGRADAGALAAKAGGGPKTEAAVAAGLKWLATNQGEGGGWSSKGHGGKMGWVDPGLSALATLAFLGAGHTHKAGAYKGNVARALTYLRGLQGEDGLFGGRRGHPLYNHALIALVLCEAYGMTRDEGLRLPAVVATRYLLGARNAEAGWRYQPRSGDSDVSVSSWCVQALVAARVAKLEVAGVDAALGEVQSWMDGLTTSTGAVGYKTRPPRGWTTATSSRFFNEAMGINTANTHRPTHAPTAIALYCQRLLGRPADDERCKKMAQRLASMLPSSDRGGGGKQNRIDSYYWFFGSHAMYQMGGDGWTRWNRAMTTAVLGLQEQDGSWAPEGAWGFAGGRVYSTAINALTLQTYYRYVRR